MVQSVTKGRPQTAMMSFSGQLNTEEIAAVVDFVRTAFIQGSDSNTYYHTPENGWTDFQRYAPAFPFATGEITQDTPWDQLTSEQRRGRRLFMSSCITCHDRDRPADKELIWEPRAVSYPRNNADEGQHRIDSESGATPYARHSKAPQVDGLSKLEQRGESLFQNNCAFCHAADGSGQNWIGSFLEPHPRNLTDPEAMAGMTDERLRSVIENGLPGTTMSAWKSVLSPDDINAIIAYISRAFYPLHGSATTQ
jgi:cytochrome c oxidase cbb3-type subunit 3